MLRGKYFLFLFIIYFFKGNRVKSLKNKGFYNQSIAFLIHFKKKQTKKKLSKLRVLYFEYITEHAKKRNKKIINKMKGK